METWIDQLAEALDEEPLSVAEVTTLLDLARDIAHSVERKVTPLSTFLLGTAVGRGLAGGTPRGRVLGRKADLLRSVLPEGPADA
jgi:hypothetical protein